MDACKPIQFYTPGQLAALASMFVGILAAFVLFS